MGRAVLLVCMLIASAINSMAREVENKTWVGGSTVNPDYWDAGTTANWSGGTDAFFQDGDSVIFGDTGAGAVSIRENVAPESVTFNNAFGDYSLDALGGFFLSASGGITVSGDGDVSILGGVAGNGTLTKSGGGTLILSGQSTFTGNVLLNESILKIQHNDALGKGRIEISDAGVEATLVLDANGLVITNDIIITSVGDDKQIKYVRSSGKTAAELQGEIKINEEGVGNFEVNVGYNETLRVSGKIYSEAPDAGLHKIGSGLLVLSGSNSFNGIITIEDGRLDINGNQGDAKGLVTVKAGATLGGSGRIGGSVVLSGDGTLAPGEEIGTLTVLGDVSFNAGSEFEVGIGTGTSCDKLIVGGALLLNDPVLKVGTIDGAGRTIAIATNGITGTFVTMEGVSLSNGDLVQGDGADGPETDYYIHYYKGTPQGSSVDHITIDTNPDSVPTSSGIELRVFQSLEGSVVEFVAYDVEADGAIELQLMGEDHAVVWSGAAEVQAAPQCTARIPVPGLEPGASYHFRLRDEVGKWWDAPGVMVQSFAAEMVSASLTGMELTFASLPDHEYEVQWIPELGSAWQTVTNLTASGTEITVVVPPPDGPTGFFRVQLK